MTLVLLAACTADPTYLVLDPEALASTTVDIPVIATNGGVSWDWSGVTEDRNGLPVDPTAYTSLQDASFDDVDADTVDGRFGCSALTYGAASSDSSETDGDTSTSSLYPHGYGALFVSGGGQPPLAAFASIDARGGSGTLDAGATVVLDAASLVPSEAPAGATGLDWSAVDEVTRVDVRRYDASLAEVASDWFVEALPYDGWALTADPAGGSAEFVDPDRRFQARDGGLEGELAFPGFDDGATWAIVLPGSCDDRVAFLAPG